MKQFTRNAVAFTALGSLTALSAGNAEAIVVASAITPSGDLNLTSYTNDWDPAGGGFDFSSAGDAFKVLQVGVSPTIPFSLVDDSDPASANFFATDSQGIVDSAVDFDPFFGTTDTVNSEVTPAGPVSATWVFDISSFAGTTYLQVDAAAMGDFEVSDLFEMTYEVDGGGAQQFFVGTGIFDGSVSRDYEMSPNGSVGTVTLEDPMNLLVNGSSTVALNDVFRTVQSTGFTGNTLTVTFSAETDGGSEAFAFRNLIVSDTFIPSPASAAMLGLGGVLIARRRR